MPAIRQISKVLKSKPTIEGAGVQLNRAFGYNEVPAFDPFLLLDDFHNTDPAKSLPGFPWHPHRGIETITYVFQGSVEHGDSMGNKGVIGPGDVQWMTAGGGIIHQEMPQKSRTGTMWGTQLWANLPAAHKMMEPRYRGLTAAEIPEATLPSGAKAKVICGEVDGVRGPVQDVVSDPEYPGRDHARRHDVHACRETGPHGLRLRPRRGRSLRRPARRFLSRHVRRRLVGPFATVRLRPRERRSLRERRQAGRYRGRNSTPSDSCSSRGKPLREPVAWYGPIVMNTREELRVAFEEYQKGTFLRHD